MTTATSIVLSRNKVTERRSVPLSPMQTTDKIALLNDEICKLTYTEKRRLIEVLAASYGTKTQPTVAMENCYPAHAWASLRLLNLLSILDRCSWFERLSVLGDWAHKLSAIADALSDLE